MWLLSDKCFLTLTFTAYSLSKSSTESFLIVSNNNMNVCTKSKSRIISYESKIKSTGDIKVITSKITMVENQCNNSKLHIPATTMHYGENENSYDNNCIITPFNSIEEFLLFLLPLI